MIYYIVKIFGCDVFSSKNTVMLLINNFISSDAVRSGQRWGISTQSSCKQKWNLEVEQTNREGCSQIIYLLQLAVLTTRSWMSGVGICLVLHVLLINCMCSIPHWHIFMILAMVFISFCWSYIITLRLRQNDQHFTDDIFKCIFLNENCSQGSN